MSDQSVGQLLVSPILRFPNEAEVGKTYLFTIDLRPQQRWPYPNDEEVTVYCLLDTAPLFSNESLGEPAVVLHRFGGSYGPARFLLTAGAQAQEGIIQVTLVNSRGVPLSVFETPVIQVREQVVRRDESDLEVSRRRVSTETSSVKQRKPARERIIVLYQHADKKWTDRLLNQMNRQRKLIDVWDERAVIKNGGLLEKMVSGINEACIVVPIVTPDFIASALTQSVELGSLIRLQMNEGLRVFPLIVRDCEWSKVDWLNKGTTHPQGGKPLSSYRRRKQEQLLGELAQDIYQHVERTSPLAADFAPPEKVEISRLPVTSEGLFGREKEMKALDEAWDDPGTNIVSLVAPGGVGKSALINHWLRAMAQDNYRGASRVYAWSFYEQGTAAQINTLKNTLRLHALGEMGETRRVAETFQRLGDRPWHVSDNLVSELHRRYILKEEPQQTDEWIAEKEFELLLVAANEPNTTASADLFIDSALRWFGDADPQFGSPSDKGQRLARLICGQRTLLVLDGLEQLQAPSGPDKGRLTDQALRALLLQLAVSNEGLCIVSTREPVTDIAPQAGVTVTGVGLENLSPEAGAEVLRARGVKGTQEELEQASREFDSHALTLTLLGSYLSDVYDGDVSRRGEITGLKADAASGDLATVLDDYEDSLGESPELDLLRLLALFDRPADGGALAALRAAPAIMGLTERLQGLDKRHWEQTLANLRRFTLLTSSPDHPPALDVHPLVRERFRQQLTQTRPDAWREGNNRLYEHLKSNAKEFPDTLEEMLPLCEAITYGCRAGRYIDAYEVYFRRVLREDQLYLQRKLGAFSLDLNTLSNFFEEPWQVLKGELGEAYGAFILDMAGSSLRALGRLTEAIQSFNASLQRRLELEDWTDAAFTTADLSTVSLIAGELENAIEFANRCDSFASQGNDRNAIQLARVILATALLQAGRYAESETAFHQAEEMQKSLGRDVPLLDSISFHYCDLLLNFDRYQEVQERAVRALELATQQGWLLETALAHLLLGQTFLHEFIRYPQAADLRKAEGFFNRAVDELGISGQLDYLPRGLLARAKMCRLDRQFERARNDLDQAMEIAMRGGMLLYQADCHLEYAQLYLAQGETRMARDSVAISKQMIERLGYHRRDEDVLEVERLLQGRSPVYVEPASETVELFFSYSHRDEDLRDELETHLAMLKNEGVIRGWHGRQITPGQEWDGKIDEHLNSAGIILLLASPTFLASRYCYDIEVARAMERHEAGEARVIPIILRPCEWQHAPFSKLQALPTGTIPITRWPDRDEAFLNVTQGIRRAVEEMLFTRAARADKDEEQEGSLPPSLIPRPPVIGFVARRDAQGRNIVERLKEELAPGRTPLVTLSGPGGIGKTTLAAEAARVLQAAYGGRVVWSSADGRADFTLLSLLDDIATQLGRAELRTLAPAEKAEQVRALVADALVVLDNYETVAEAEQRRIEAWFKRTQCSALFTSRPRVPDTTFVPVSAMSREEATEFLERLAAQTQDPGLFTPEVCERIYQTAEANPFVMQWVVGQTDLAQEPGAVLEELQHGEGDAAEHIFDRSFELPLLGEDGRDALLALSLFAPSATPDALAAVAGFDDAGRVREAVGNLRRLWLVKGVDGNRRLAVEGLMRTLAAARLSKDPRADEFRRRFVAYFLRYAEARREPAPENYDALEGEKDNLLGAAEVAFASGDRERVVRMAFALATGDTGMLFVRGYWDETVKLGEQALQAARSSHDEAPIARLSHNLAVMYQERGELTEARRLYDESLKTEKRLGDESGVATTLHQLGKLAQEQGEFEEARRLYDESLVIKKQLGNQGGIASTLNELGRLAREQGEFEEARRLYDESLEINKRFGNQGGIAITLHQLAVLAQNRGELEEARRLYDESLGIKKRLGDQGGVAITLHQLGRLAEDEGDKEGAARLFRESLSIFERLGSPNAEIARQNLARVEGVTS